MLKLSWIQTKVVNIPAMKCPVRVDQKKIHSQSDAIMLNSDAYVIVDNEMAIYDPKIQRLGFEFEDIR